MHLASDFRWLAPTIVFAVACISAAGILVGQFHGEDEISVLAIGEASLHNPAILGAGVHAPGRYVTAAISTALGGPNLFSLRVPHWLFWAATVALAASIAQRLHSPLAGLTAGLILALSGLWHTEAFAGGHAMATFWILLLIWYKLKYPSWKLETSSEQRQYWIGGLLGFLSFLWFTDGIVINAAYHLLYLAYNRRAFKTYALVAWPFLALFIAYYAIFLGIPYLLLQTGQTDHAIGQLHQYWQRADAAQLNLSALKENFFVLNWYQFPILPWLLVLLGITWLLKRRRDILFLIAPHILIFSFYIVSGTPQHFFSDYIYLVPFGVISLISLLNPGQVTTRDTLIPVALIIAAISGFSYWAHVTLYTETTYPETLVTRSFGATLTRRNVWRPLPTLAADLERLLAAEDVFSVTSDRALPNYYFRDGRYQKIPFTLRTAIHGPCVVLTDPPSRLRAVVIDRREPLCPEYATERLLTYPESYLAIAVLPAS